MTGSVNESGPLSYAGESEVDVHTLVGQTSVAGGQGDYTLLILYATLASVHPSFVVS